MYTATNEDRMFLYLWSDIKVDSECKFGERWVKAGLDPETDCRRRIRDSLGVKKGEYDQGDIVVHQIWDVTDIAKAEGRYYKASRMDDLLRAKIGYRKGTTGEIHLLSGEEFKIKVNELIQQYDQKLIVAKLSTAQTNAAVDVLSAYKSGKRVVLAELCARFGKTIFSAAVATEAERELVIVASYVKTVFTSFATDIIMFEQFRDYVHVDTGIDGYEKKIEDAFAAGKKVFAYLSMCNGSKRASRVEYLFSHNKAKMLIIDEADFGIHKKGQSQLLTEAFHGDDHVLIMTGTNSDRAVGNWKIDHMVSTTYFELLVQKKEAA